MQKNQSADRVFQITCDGTIGASEWVRRGCYDYADQAFTDELFPIQAHPKAIRTVELVELDWSGSYSLCVPLRRLGLALPTHEDTFIFGATHRELKTRPIIFPHQEVRLVGCDFSTMICTRHRRELLLHLASNAVDSHYFIAGVREEGAR